MSVIYPGRHRDMMERSCKGCRWYHEWFGVCCNGDSEQRGDVSERCDLYDMRPQKGQKVVEE